MEKSNVKHHTERATKFGTACDATVKFIKEMGLKRDQVISITSNDYDVSNGEAQITVLYKPLSSGHSEDLSDITYKLWRNTDPWDTTFKDVTNFSKNVSPVEFSCNPKEMGTISVAILWYKPGRGVRQDINF